MRPQREIPYFEIEGQLDLATDFPEVVPEPAEQVRPETRTFMMNVADLVGDDVELEKIDGVVATVATESAEKPEMDHEVRRRYCNAAARKLIEAKYDWMREDYKNRVLMVDESEKQLKALLFKSGSLTWYFSDPYGIGMTRVNLFPDYIQFFNEDCGGWVGNCSWFYLCAAIQGMWNEVVLEKAAAGAVAISQQNGNVEESTKLDEKAEMNTARLEIQSGTQRSSILCADMINDVPLSDLNLLKEMLEQEVSIWQETKVIFEENSEFYRKVRIRAAALVCLLEKMDGANEPDEPE